MGGESNYLKTLTVDFVWLFDMSIHAIVVIASQFHHDIPIFREVSVFESVIEMIWKEERIWLEYLILGNTDSVVIDNQVYKKTDLPSWTGLHFVTRESRSLTRRRSIILMEGMMRMLMMLTMFTQSSSFNIKTPMRRRQAIRVTIILVLVPVTQPVESFWIRKKEKQSKEKEHYFWLQIITNLTKRKRYGIISWPFKWWLTLCSLHAESSRRRIFENKRKFYRNSSTSAHLYWYV